MGNYDLAMKKHVVYFLLVVTVCFVYLFLRLSYQNTIEFGYDQPRLATRVLEFIKDGNFFNTQKFAERSPWGNISWGPSLFLFFSPFLLISQHPLVVSSLMAVFNIVSVVVVIIIGKRYFSPLVGIIAGAFLATQPWWVIFSRMIYQPTPVPTFIALSMLLFFAVFEKPKSPLIIFLVLSWTFLVQLYFHTFSFISISGALIVFGALRKISLKFLVLGLVLSSFLFLPYFNGQNLTDYIPSNSSIQSQLQDGRDDIVSRVKSIIPHYFQIISGGDFAWQLGNGYSDFIKENPNLTIYSEILLTTTIVIIVYNLCALIFISKKRLFRLSLILWTIAPVFFLVLIRISNVPPIPRYFLISLPPLALLWGLFISETARYFTYVAVVPVFIYWAFFVIKYYNFIENYTYPSGLLSVYSDVPYSFIENSINFILKDARAKNYRNIVISNDESNPKVYSLNWATGYTWTNVLHKDTRTDNNKNTGYYLLNFSTQALKPEFKKLFRSGPYTVYRVSL